CERGKRPATQPPPPTAWRRPFQSSRGSQASTKISSSWPGWVYDTVTLQKLASVTSMDGWLSLRKSGEDPEKPVTAVASTERISAPRRVGVPKVPGVHKVDSSDISEGFGSLALEVVASWNRRKEWRVRMM